MAKLIEGFLKVKPNSLNLDLTLTTGQNFRWRKSPANENEWIGVIDNFYVVALEQTSDQIMYKVLNTQLVQQQFDECQAGKTGALDLRKSFVRSLESYFRLDSDIDTLYTKWFKNDTHFNKTSNKYRGIRLLRQNIPENIFSFICSTNNNVARISTMVEALCERYGTPLYKCDDVGDIYSFPVINALTDPAVEADLRTLGFGYRAKFIYQTAKKIIDESEDDFGGHWIRRLTMMTYADAKAMLMTLPGIGAKVADCICLMSLEHTQAIPIDTHIYQLTTKYYLPNLKSTKSLSASKYNEIADFYREKFPVHPGWAQTVLFCMHLLKAR